MSKHYEPSVSSSDDENTSYVNIKSNVGRGTSSLRERNTLKSSSHRNASDDDVDDTNDCGVDTQTAGLSKEDAVWGDDISSIDLDACVKARDDSDDDTLPIAPSKIDLDNEYLFNFDGKYVGEVTANYESYSESDGEDAPPNLVPSHKVKSTTQTRTLARSKSSK